MHVDYKKLNLLAVGDVTFKPGVNDYPNLDSKKIEEMKKLYPKFRTAIEDGDIEIKGGEQRFFEDENGAQSSSEGFSIAGLKDKDAIDTVKRTGDLALLNRWLNETRSNAVKKAIQDQIKAYEKAGEKE